jgi:hypothetical protein
MLDPILDVPNKTTSDTSFDAILDKKIPDPDPWLNIVTGSNPK